LEANRSSDSICRGMYFILSILNCYFKKLKHKKDRVNQPFDSPA
jgi:hypothetical protein